MVLLEKYKADLQFIRKLLRPRQWSTQRKLSARIDEDIADITPFFAADAQAPAAGKTVLMASFINRPFAMKFEGLFCRMLQSRGWRSASLLDPYDGRFAKRYHAEALGNPTHRIQSFVQWSDYGKLGRLADEVMAAGPDSIHGFKYKESLVGMNALSTASMAEGSGTIRLGDADYRARLRLLLIRSCLFSDACVRLFEKVKPNLIMTIEKGGVGYSELFHQAIRCGVDFVQWSHCHQPDSFMFKRYNPGNTRSHPFSVSAQSWETACALPWDERYREAVTREFEEGYGGNKWFKYKKLTDHTKVFGKPEIMQRFKLDPARKTAVIFSHILNDANLFYGKDLFQGGFKEWLVETVREAMKNPGVNWVLKLHPANLFRRANSGYTGEFGEILALREGLGEVPKNLTIVYPDDPVNPLSWFRNLDYAVTVRGTIGAEIPCFGKPVLTAGTGRYSGLGFTEDSATREEYLGRIRNIQSIPPLDERRERLALRHAYLFFQVRPASYGTFAEERNRYPAGHPLSLDIAFRAAHYRDLAGNPQLKPIIDWLGNSRNEDFLAAPLGFHGSQA